MDKIEVTFTLNEVEVTRSIAADSRLLDLLRYECGETGTKEGCGEGECGACSVIMDGKLVNSCLVPAAQCSGADVLTVDGLAATPRGQMISESFATEHGAQCGFCTPGMVMAAEALLRENGAPDESAVREGLAGNICRCTGYDMIVDAIQDAAERGKGLW